MKDGSDNFDNYYTDMVIVAFLTIKAFMKIMIFLTNMKSQIR